MLPIMVPVVNKLDWHSPTNKLKPEEMPNVKDKITQNKKILILMIASTRFFF
jgi:hypothetical protein